MQEQQNSDHLTQKQSDTIQFYKSLRSYQIVRSRGPFHMTVAQHNSYLATVILEEQLYTSLIPSTITIGSGDAQQNSMVPTETIQVHKLHHSTLQWFLSVIGYALDNGYSQLPKAKSFLMFMVFLWNIFNECFNQQLNIKMQLFPFQVSCYLST